MQNKIFTKKELVGNFDFFQFGVATKFDDFHTVQKWLGDVVGSICCANKQHFGKVVWHFQEVVGKTEVLFRVQHFQHCTCRVATIVLAHLVNFVQ